jgi:transposase InsO family protein
LGRLKQRCLRRHQFETLDQAREVIGAYLTYYHHRPHSRLDYRTPARARGNLKREQDHLIPAA